jgi:hypothetical protein
VGAAFTAWKNFAENMQTVRAHRTAKKKAKESTKNVIITYVDRTHKNNMVKTLEIWRSVIRTNKKNFNTMKATEAYDPTIQQDPQDPNKKRSSNTRWKESRHAHVMHRSNQEQDHQTAQKHKQMESRKLKKANKQASERRGQPTEQDRLRLARARTTTTGQQPSTSIQASPSSNNPVTQTYYSPAILFAPETIPAQSPPRRGRYKTIQRGKARTTTRHNHASRQRSTPTTPVLSSRPQTRHQGVAKYAALHKDQHRQNPRNTNQSPLESQTTPTSPHIIQENSEDIRDLVDILLNIQYKKTISVSSPSKDNIATIQRDPKHQKDNEGSTQPVQKLMNVKSRQDAFRIVDRTVDSIQRK